MRVDTGRQFFAAWNRGIKNSQNAEVSSRVDNCRHGITSIHHVSPRRCGRGPTRDHVDSRFVRIQLNRMPAGIHRDPHDPAPPHVNRDPQESACPHSNMIPADPCCHAVTRDHADPCCHAVFSKKINLAPNPLPDFPAVAPAPKELALSLDMDL